MNVSVLFCFKKTSLLENVLGALCLFFVDI
jgi:hypothetical protein